MDTRDTRLLVLRNITIATDETNIRIPGITRVINCYKWLMYNKIISPDYKLSKTSPDNQIILDHFCYDTFNLTTKKFKNSSEFKSQYCRKQHTIISI